MLDNIRNPPKGFETIIKRHFYLKKEEIMKEVKKWIKYAEVREANYTGLINDHNSNIIIIFIFNLFNHSRIYISFSNE